MADGYALFVGTLFTDSLGTKSTKFTGTYLSLYLLEHFICERFLPRYVLAATEGNVTSRGLPQCLAMADDIIRCIF